MGTVSETTYYKDKLYVPKDVKAKLRLSDGDKLEIEVVGEGEARIRVKGSAEATRRLLLWLDDPPIKGAIIGGLSRREIYEDHP